MGVRSNFTCNKCGNIFAATIGNLRGAYEVRCMDCDEHYYSEIEIVEAICKKCGGKMGNKITSPMCPKCKSRDNVQNDTLIYLD